MVHVRRAPPLDASRASRRLRGAPSESFEVIPDDDEVEAAPATAVAPAATAAAEAARRASPNEEPSSSSPGAAAAAAAAPPSLAPASALEEATCGICLELVAAAHAVAGCGHVFCGACLGKSIQASFVGSPAAAPPRCPQCRAPILAAPTRVRMLDNIVACLVAVSEGNGEERASVSTRVAAFDRIGGGGSWANGGGSSGGGGNGSSRALDGAEVARIFARLPNSSVGRQPSLPLRAPSRVDDGQGEGEDSESDDDDEDDDNDEDDDEEEEDPPLSNRAQQPRIFNAEEARARDLRLLHETVSLQRAAAVSAIERVGGGGGGAALEQARQELRLQRLEQQVSREQNGRQEQRVSQRQQLLRQILLQQQQQQQQQQ